MARFPDLVGRVATALFNMTKLVALACPAIAACVFWSRLSSRPRTTLLTASLGGLAGLYYSPFAMAILRYLVILSIGRKPTWSGTTLSFQDDVIPTAIAAFACGFLSWSISKWKNNDGTENWTGDWTEIDDNGLAASGNIRIENNVLRIDNLDAGTLESVSRSFDIGAATTATLTMDYHGIREGTVGGDRFTVEGSDDGGSTWALLEEVIVPGETTANLPFSGSLSYALQ